MKSSNLSLSENFGNMEPLVGQNQIDRLLRGLVKQPTEKADFNFVEDVSLFSNNFRQIDYEIDL